MGFINDFVNMIYGLLVGYEHLGIFIMMTLESTFIPFPSEVAMIPAGIEAANGNINIYWAIFWGTFGSWVGSTINYVIARYYGRDFIAKYGRYVRIDMDKISKLDKYFKNHGPITVFIVRFVPIVRQYISFPAGMAEMRFSVFSFYTTLGAGIWVTILAILGLTFGDVFGDVFANQEINFVLLKERIKPHINELLLYTCGFLTLLIVFYSVFKKKYLD